MNLNVLDILKITVSNIVLILIINVKQFRSSKSKKIYSKYKKTWNNLKVGGTFYQSLHFYTDRKTEEKTLCVLHFPND